MAGIDNLKPFQKGDGRTRGRKPKGAIHLSTHIQNALNDPDFEIWLEDRREGFKKFQGTPMKAIIAVALRKAASGDKRWADWLADNGYGKQLRLTDDDGGPLTIKMVSYTKDSSDV